MNENQIHIGKEEIYYRYSPAIPGKETFLILHGWGGKSDSWLSVGEILVNKGFGVYIPDLPGFGKTEIQQVHTLDSYTSVIESFTKELGLKNIVLVGHSNGGAIATKLAITDGLDIQTLILNNSAGIRNNHARKFKRALYTPIARIVKLFQFLPFYSSVRERIYRIIGSGDCINAEKENIFLKKTYLNMISHDLLSDFQKINIKTLLIWGEEDTLTPLSDARVIRMNIKDSLMEVVPGAGHSIHLKSPLLLTELLLKSLR